MALTLIFLAPLIGLIPQATLGALVLVTAAGLIKVGEFRAASTIGILAVMGMLTSCRVARVLLPSMRHWPALAMLAVASYNGTSPNPFNKRDQVQVAPVAIDRTR